MIQEIIANLVQIWQLFNIEFRTIVESFMLDFDRVCLNSFNFPVERIDLGQDWSIAIFIHIQNKMVVTFEYCDYLIQQKLVICTKYQNQKQGVLI